MCLSEGIPYKTSANPLEMHSKKGPPLKPYHKLSFHRRGSEVPEKHLVEAEKREDKSTRNSSQQAPDQSGFGQPLDMLSFSRNSLGVSLTRVVVVCGLDGVSPWDLVEDVCL